MLLSCLGYRHEFICCSGQSINTGGYLETDADSHIQGQTEVKLHLLNVQCAGNI